LPEAIKFVFELPEYDKQMLVWKKSTPEDAKKKLKELTLIIESITKWDKQTLNDKIIAWVKENEYGVGDCLWPMRVALCGQQNSPGPFDIAEVLGKDNSIERITIAIGKL